MREWLILRDQEGVLSAGSWRDSAMRILWGPKEEALASRPAANGEVALFRR
jgi:hypothetical protein